MKYPMFTALFATALAGCGGGASSDGTNSNTGNGGTPPPAVQYTANSHTSAGGQISPTSLTVNAGQTGQFTVTANNGFVLNNISGCGGSLAGNLYTTGLLTANCTVTADFITNAENALRHRDHRLASASELISHAQTAINQSEVQRKALVDELFQGISSITWHPSHDSISFTSFLPERTTTLLPSNQNGNGDSEIRGLVMVSEQGSQRSAAMAANLFAVNTSADTDAVLKRLIAWLTKGADQTAGFSVVTAQMPSNADSWYFPHNEAIRSWLQTHYPNSHTINDANNCDDQQLSACIDARHPDLIILSDIDRHNLGYQGIAAAVAKAQAAGIPLLLSNYRREASPMLSPLYQQMGLVSYGNYWAKLNANALSVETIRADDANISAVQTLLSNLQSGHFSTALLDSCTGNFLSCNSSDFVSQYKAGADWLRNALVTLDSAGQDVLDLSEAETLKASILLADHYRGAIDYPIEWSESQAWQQALFADWVVNYARPDNLGQPDLGEYVIDRSKLSKNSNANYAKPATLSERKTLSVPFPKQWTTTGWYVLPGQTVTLTRHDSSTARISVKLNYHRPNTNRAYEQKVYRAPLELATQRLRLASGQSIQFSSPYGGPLYLYLDGADGALSTDITASGVAHHPTIMDFSDSAQIATFNQTLSQTELPHVDLRTDGAEQHLRRDRFTNAIDGSIPDVSALLTSIANDHINAVYTLAGLKIQGKTLAQSLPTEVSRACVNLFGDDCLNANLHTRNIIQHANYDQNAHCGAGCSGNPWDAAWNISPTGWGDNHELGHNLQTNKLNVQYASAADRDNWAGYSSRAGENSNNIFPYVVKWQAHYLRDGNSNTITDGHMNHKDLFYVFMSDAAAIKNASNERVVLGANCKVLDVGNDRYEAPWKSNNYAVHNGYRMAFYIQMALRAHGMTLSDGTKLSNGFNIFTLLYQQQRLFAAAAADASAWDNQKTQLGFGQFPYSGHSIYAGKTIAAIPGNDFMLVALSRLTARNWQNHFDLLGLRYSSLAAAQAQANTNQGNVAMGMYQLDTELPPATMSEGLTFLPLSLSDNSTQWRDGSSPVNCQP